MMQGDASYLGISVLNSGGSVVEPRDIRDMEITIGNLTKSYRAEQLGYSGGVWLFPLSQGESFGLLPGPVQAQVRLAWANGVVEGVTLYGIHIDESISKEVL